MWLLISAIVILLISSFLHAYCGVGITGLLVNRPMIFDSSAGRLLQIGWIVLLTVGIVMLFIENWIWGFIGIAAYWLLLRLLIIPIAKKHIYKQ